MLAGLLIVVAAYLIGSVSFAVVVSKAYGLPDPHEYGSGNPGATNVLRTGNKAAALWTLVGDGLKGFVAVFAAIQVAPLVGAPAWAVPAAAIAVFIGHCWPVFHGFKGGKGVSTGAGIVFAPIYYVWLFGVNAMAAAVAAMSVLLVWRHRENLRRLIAGEEGKIGR